MKPRTPARASSAAAGARFVTRAFESLVSPRLTATGNTKPLASTRDNSCSIRRVVGEGHESLLTPELVAAEKELLAPEAEDLHGQPARRHQRGDLVERRLGAGDQAAGAKQQRGEAVQALQRVLEDRRQAADEVRRVPGVDGRPGELRDLATTRPAPRRRAPREGGSAPRRPRRPAGRARRRRAQRSRRRAGRGTPPSRRSTGPARRRGAGAARVAGRRRVSPGRGARRAVADRRTGPTRSPPGGAPAGGRPPTIPGRLAARR